MSSLCEDYSSTISKIAIALHHSNSLKFGTFKIKSGITSPYYIDLTWLLASPKDFICVRDLVVNKIREIKASYEIDRLASIELKGALLLPSIALKLKMASVVVRKAQKKYGLMDRIAGGVVTEGEKTVFFDDVISTGKSKLEGIKHLTKLGAKVEHVVVVVDREHGGKEIIERAGYKFHSLTKISELVTHLLCSQHLSKDKAKAVLKYIKKVEKSLHKS